MSGAGRFIRVPRRIHDAWERDAITFNGVALLVYLAGIADHESHEAVRTMSAIIDGSSWPLSKESLRRTLHALRDAGQLDFESRPGQRSKTTFRLPADWFADVPADLPAPGDLHPDLHTTSTQTGDLHADLHTTSTREGGSGVEVTSTTRKSRATATPHLQTDSTSSQPPQRGGVLEELETRQDLDELSALPSTSLREEPRTPADAVGATVPNDEPSVKGTCSDCSETTELHRHGTVLVCADCRARRGRVGLQLRERTNSPTSDYLPRPRAGDDDRYELPDRLGGLDFEDFEDAA